MENDVWLRTTGFCLCKTCLLLNTYRPKESIIKRKVASCPISCQGSPALFVGLFICFCFQETRRAFSKNKKGSFSAFQQTENVKKEEKKKRAAINYPFDLNMLLTVPLAANRIRIVFVIFVYHRHHRNFLPVDYSLDGWQSPKSDNFLKIRSLPSECEHQTEMEETNSSAVSWSDTISNTTNPGRKQPTASSPKICVQRDVHVDRSFEGQSSIVSERSCSYDSQESSHFLDDHETDSRCYSPSRKPSFGSICSDSCTENMDSRTSVKPTRSSHHNSLSRSSSSRSTFLSVPTRVPNHLWLSSASDHQTDHNKEHQSSVNSQLGSTSSLMASHFSLSK